MANSNLINARRAKNDEFYTQYHDIEKEVAAYVEFNPDVFRNKTVFLPCDNPEWSNFTKFFALNFQALGLKKLISTSYAADNNKTSACQSSLFDEKDGNPQTSQRGRIYTLTAGRSKVDVNDLDWGYLKGDGDFRSEEVSALRDNADFIITNPPFSLFREFLAWVVKVDKQFLLIGNKNVITYKEVFPLIKANKMWVGATSFSKDMLFISPEEIDPTQKPISATRTVDGKVYLRSPSVWFASIDHGRRHQPMQLMSIADNLQYNKKLKGAEKYDSYDNYNAIEVPFTNAIPSDYNGVMGVPITFLDKYSPEQFEIVGYNYDVIYGLLPDIINPKWAGKLDRGYVKSQRMYSRLLIKHKTYACYDNYDMSG